MLTPQIEQCQASDRDRRPHPRVGTDSGEDRADIRNRGRHRDRDRQYVIEEQCTGNDEPPPWPKIPTDNLVIAATVGVGADVLSVGQCNDEEHDNHASGDPRPVCQGGDTTQRKNEKDLLGRVGIRRQRITGEHRHRAPLRERRPNHVVTPQCPTEEHALDAVTHRHGQDARRGQRNLLGRGRCSVTLCTLSSSDAGESAHS